MPTGIVERFNSKRGFGFINPDDGGDNVFVHQNNIEMDGFRFLKAGEKVEYEEEESDKGVKAIDVKLVSPREDRPPRRSFPPRHNPYKKDEYDMERLTKDLLWMKGALNRLIDVMANEGEEGEDAMLTEEEIEHIRHGNGVG